MSDESRSSSSSIAAAFELAAILGYIFGVAELSLQNWLYGLAGVGLVFVAIGSAFWIRRATAVDDEKQDRHRHVVYGKAWVDDKVLAKLRDEAMPLHIIRAVRRVGTQKSLRRFRIMLEKECRYDMTDEQLEKVLDQVRQPPAVSPEPSPASSPEPSPTSSSG